MINSNVITPKILSPLTLAFIGDAVFDLLVRRHLVYRYNESIGSLNKKKSDIVCCKSQSKAIDVILGLLTEDELIIYKRGRNAHPKHSPKHSSIVDYSRATGLECLFGYLYLSGSIKRMDEIIKEIYKVLDI